MSNQAAALNLESISRDSLISELKGWIRRHDELAAELEKVKRYQDHAELTHFPKDLIEEAMEEIRTLRRRVEILQGKVDTMDLFALVLTTIPRDKGLGESVDMLWKLQVALDQEKLRRPSVQEVEPLLRRGDDTP